MPGVRIVIEAPRSQALDAKKEALVGDCLLTSGFLSYTGAFTHEFRAELIFDTWLKNIRESSLPHSANFR